MQRAAHLFESILSGKNLKLAFSNAAKGKRSHADVRSFGDHLPERIKQMSHLLRDGEFPLGRFHQFLIRDPKERVITAPCFDERVLHHAIMNVCEPVFDRWLINDTYACRKGKGREVAIARAASFSKRFEWYLKLDIRKYFDSISHSTLQRLLRRRFKDQRLLQLLDQIIGCYRGTIGYGLPIGSLTSQHLANFYLGWFDRFVKETLRIRGYVRYMDDMILWHDDRAALRRLETQCVAFLAETLSLEPKPMIFQRTAGGVDFLGCRIFPTHVALSRRSKRRWRNRVRILERATRLGLLSESEQQVRLEAATAFAKGAGVRSWRFRTATLQQSTVDGP